MMLLRSHLLVSCWLVLAAGTVAAQDDDVVGRVLKPRVRMFFENLAREEVESDKAFNELLANGPLSGREEVIPLIGKYSQLEETYGKFIESEAIGAKTVGRDLVLLKYLYKMERFPVVWYFTYYRPPTPSGEGTKWVIISLRFDTRLDLLDLTERKPDAP